MAPKEATTPPAPPVVAEFEPIEPDPIESDEIPGASESSVHAMLKATERVETKVDRLGMLLAPPSTETEPDDPDEEESPPDTVVDPEELPFEKFLGDLLEL